MLTLYHGRTSVCSLKVRLALAEKGLLKPDAGRMESRGNGKAALRWGVVGRQQADQTEAESIAN